METSAIITLLFAIIILVGAIYCKIRGKKQEDWKTNQTIKVIMPHTQDVEKNTSDIRFRFYIGYKKKNNFRMISDPSLPYNKWTFLCDASTQDFAIYYSPRSEAASGTLSIYEVYKKNCRLEQAKEGAGIYYRAVAPDVIEYAVISNDDFDSEKMVDNVTRVELTY